jgi:DNA end-binding protein Ku
LITLRENNLRAAWKGYISIGQLGIAVRLYNAERSQRPDFVLLHESDGSPVERVLKCRAEDKEISYAETVRAIEHQPGKYLTFTPNELAGLDFEQSKLITIKQFSEPDDIAPAYYQRPFYIVPSGGGERAYGLLREALQRSRKVAIGQFIIHNKEHIGAIASYRDLLILYQLRFDAELVPRSEIKTPAIPKASPPEIDALTELIDRFSGPFHIQDYHDEQTERIHELVQRKAKGLKMPKSRAISLRSSNDEDLLPIIKSTLQNAGTTISRSTARNNKSAKKGIANAAHRSRAK